MVHGWPTLYNSVDNILYAIAGISVVLLAGVTGTMIWFVIRYNRKRHPRAENIEGNLWLEILWTVIPTILVMGMFYAGWKGFVYKRTVPPDAMLVKVTARMWSWHFEYENGATSGVLKLPLGKPVKLLLTSADVLHSLFIPAFRVKEDCVPNMETYLWFQPDEPGTYDLFCSEYCGTGHSGMITTAEVLPEPEFGAWYRTAAALPVATGKRPDGAKLFQEKGCFACHSIDGTAKVGPTLKGVYGRKTTVLTAGKERQVTVNDIYLKTSILDPQADLVKGFPPVMPPQKGLLTDEEVGALIVYLKTLK
jgi:cytochrome c oxidase subunit 2